MPLIEAKNSAHTRALRSCLLADKKEFRHCQRFVKKAVIEAKERWICTVTKRCRSCYKGWSDKMGEH